MHLKNFSLLKQPGLGMTIAPAYDLVNTALVNPQDEEEMALSGESGEAEPFFPLQFDPIVYRR